jgi:glycolate oxidase
LMSRQFSEDTLDTIRDLKTLFDPGCRLNAGKLLPLGKGCMEIRQRPLIADSSVL